jgi:hypothetical protein
VSYVFTERDKAEFNRIRRKIDSIRGPGVTNGPDAIAIFVPQASGGVTVAPKVELPIGQYPGMVWITVANNQAAFAYPFAVQTV